MPVPFVSSKHESDAEHDKLPPSPSLLMYVLQKRVATSTRAMGSVKGLCTDFPMAFFESPRAHRTQATARRTDFDGEVLLVVCNFTESIGLRRFMRRRL